MSKPLPIPVGPIFELMKWKADQWDRLVEHITYEGCRQRFIIDDITCAQHDIQLRKE